VIIREDIKNGERIREYKVQALVNGKWQTVCDGQSVGNKRIQEFDTVNTNKLRLIVDKSVATPLIRDFSVYFVE
jgi:alpha-L-fucosidase